MSNGVPSISGGKRPPIQGLPTWGTNFTAYFNAQKPGQGTRVAASEGLLPKDTQFGSSIAYGDNVGKKLDISDASYFKNSILGA